MNVRLMFREKDYDVSAPPEPHAEDLKQDLELPTLFETMAAGDKFLYKVAENAVLSSLYDAPAVRYRQNILMDCIKNSDVVRELYTLAVETIENKNDFHFGIFSRFPSAVLHTSRNMLHMFMSMLKKLRKLAEQRAASFESRGFVALFAMLKAELDDDYFTLLENHLEELSFRGGVLVSARLGKGLKGKDYLLRRAPVRNKNFLRRLFAKKSPAFSFIISERDTAGAQALSDLRDQGIHLAADVLARSTEHINNFFTLLRTELAFYVGCLNLRDRMAAKGLPSAFPSAMATGNKKHSARGLYDICLALAVDHAITGNDVKADDRNPVIITGANQGGKSTFLRSIGLAHLMMQCGMFVPAASFTAGVCSGLFTHFRRKEDATMRSGKLDEELARMSGIADRLQPHALVLFNESFAATNEREGSEIAGHITGALAEKRIRVFFVTHQYEFARRMYERNRNGALFLRAERLADGRRTFRVRPGEPLPYSHGIDLFRKIFAERQDGTEANPPGSPVGDPFKSASEKKRGEGADGRRTPSP